MKNKDIRKIIDKVRNFTINESEKTLEDFYSENNIDPENLSYLGKGDFGVAYSTNDGRVVKRTTSKSEFSVAKEIEQSDSPVLDSFVKIYKTEIIKGEMYILQEELIEDSHIEDLYSELQSYLDDQDLPIQYLDQLDTDDLDISDELQKFMDDIDDINRAYRYLGIEASDIRPENLGYSEDGKLKAFDIDDKQR
jgi:hypothetical protein